MLPLPDEAVPDLGGCVEPLARWASVHPGASAVCPGAHCPQLMEGTVCLKKKSVFVVCCEQSST